MTNHDIELFEKRMHIYLVQQHKKAGDKLSKRDQINLMNCLDINMALFEEFVNALVSKDVFEIEQDLGERILILK